MPWKIIDNREPSTVRESNGMRERTRTMMAVATPDEPSENLTTEYVLALPGIPKRFDAYPGDALSLVYARDASPESGNPRVFSVVISYSTRASDNSNEDNENPLARRARRLARFQEITEPMFEDEAGVPVVTSCGLPPGELPERVINIPVLIYVKNLPFESIFALSQITNTVNSDIFLGHQPGEVKLTIEPGDEQFEFGVWYCPVSFSFMFRPLVEVFTGFLPDPTTVVASAWDAIFADRHVYALKSDGGDPEVLKLYRLVDSMGDPIQEPVFLDGTGQPMVPTPPHVPLPSDQRPAMIVRQAYRRANFTEIAQDYALFS